MLFPRPSGGDHDDYGGNLYMSARSGFGQFLRRSTTFPDAANLTLADTEPVIRQLLEKLRLAGIVKQVMAPRNADDVPGYQLSASALLWVAGDGAKSFHDPIRIPYMPTDGGRTNPFFVKFYREVAQTALGLEAREHRPRFPLTFVLTGSSGSLKANCLCSFAVLRWNWASIFANSTR